MAFPINPADGLQTTINGVTYTYSSANRSWTRVPVNSVQGNQNIFTDSFTANGNQTDFALSSTPPSTNFIMANIDGVFQLKSAYTLTNNIIRFTSVPPSNSKVDVTFLTNGATAYTTRYYVGTGSQTDFTVTNGTNADNILLTENGVLQIPNIDYTVSGTVLRFAVAPLLNVQIQVRELYVPSIPSALDNTARIVSNTAINIAYNAANTANIALLNTSNTALIQANASFTQANAAYTYANTSVQNTSVITVNSLLISSNAIWQQSQEKYQTKTGVGSAVTYDFSTGGTFYHTGVTSAIQATLTNLDNTSGRVTVFCCPIVQGATPYIINSITVNGSTPTIKWINNSTPTGNANKLDVITFSLLNNGGTYTVLGSLTTYG